MPIGYMPDSFGHIGQMPQILSGFGIQAAALWRGLSNQPAELWWQSPDGSKILLAYMRDSYSNGANLPVHDSELFIEQIAIVGNSLSAHSAVNDHLIMLGTDHMEPSPRTSASIDCANANLLYTGVIHSTLPGYIETIKAQIASGKSIPTVRGELRACDHSPLLPGVLSTRMWIKQRNQHSQTLLEKWAEPFGVFAENMISKQGMLSSPEEIASNRIYNTAPIIRQVWRLLMENHPHDSICGCSIDQVHDEMRPRFDQVDQIAEELSLQSLQALARAVDTHADSVFSSIVLFNPHGHARRDVVEIALNIPEIVPAFELLDADQTVIPYEFIGASNAELANLLLKKNELRNTIGAINEGRVAGAAITSIKVTRQDETVIITTILDYKGQPNIREWQQAEADIARYEADPTVTHFYVLAHTPKVSSIRFVTPEIPAFGWRVIWVRTLPVPASAPTTTVNPLIKPFLPLFLRIAETELGSKLLDALNTSDETKPPFVIENDFFRVEAVPDGTLTVIDKSTNSVFTGLNQFMEGGDSGDEYNYSPPAADSISTPKPATIKVSRNRLIPTLEIAYTFSVPTQLSPDRKARSKKRINLPITSRISLAPGVARINIHTEVDNTAKDHRLRVHFPVPFAVDNAHYDGHFEVIQRPLGLLEKTDNWSESPRPETHQGAFTSVTNGKIGLTIANRGLPEVEVIRLLKPGETEIAITLLRCIGWLSRDDMPVRQGHAGPAFETPGAQLLGKWAFDYAIIPHRGTWKNEYQNAYAFQTTLRAIQTSLHDGEIPNHGAFISHSPDEFVISAVKETEDGKGWIVRGYNISSESIQLNLKPLMRFSNARLVNLAEEEISALQVGNNGNITTSVPGHKILSIMFSRQLDS